MHKVLSEHRHYLADTARVEAYRLALEATIRPGDVVLDLGAGTGILGLLACAAGARRVYAVDDGPVLELARAIAVRSGYADRIVHVRGHSSWMDLPEAVDVIVADQVGHFGCEAGMFDAVIAARDRWLAAGGRIVPRQIDLWVAPAEMPSARAAVNFWAAPVAGFDLSAVVPVAAAVPQPVDGDPESLRAPGQRLIEGDVMSYSGGPLSGEARCPVTRPGRMDGVLGWFVTELAPGVVMTNAPSALPRVARQPLWLPVEHMELSKGDTVHVRVSASPGYDLMAWYVDVQDASGHAKASCRRSALEAVPLSAERLHATHPRSKPELSRAGRALAHVLALCDGEHSIETIEAEVMAGFPEVFTTREAASAFVATILGRHAR